MFEQIRAWCGGRREGAHRAWPTGSLSWLLVAGMLFWGSTSAFAFEDDDFWADDEDEFSWDDDWGDTPEDSERFWEDGFEPDESFVFEDDDFATGDVSDAAARFMDDGLRYYDEGDYVAASVFFWRVMTDEDPGARPLRPRAQFELARTLVRMDLLQSAIFFFDAIIEAGEAHPYFEDAAPWMLVVAERLPGDFQMLRRLSAFEVLFPDRLDPEYHDDMAFYLGQHAYNTGELERALQYMQLVNEFSSHYPHALFVMGVTHVRLLQASPASGAFEELLRLSEEARARDREMQRLGDLARLSLARTLYSTGEFQRSADLYDSIERGGEFWLDALFESAWADFRREEFNRALGNLHSLNSPFFDDQFYPEAPLLQAVIFLVNCHYREVRDVLEEFELIYVPLREELEDTLADLQTSRDYHSFLVDAGRRVQGRFEPRLMQILDATLGDRTVRESLAYIESLEDELAFIERADRAWAGSELADYLRERLENTRGRGVERSGDLASARLQALFNQLRRYERDANAILIQTDLEERDDLQAGTLRTVEGDRPRPASHQIRWTFEGEYWRDEIGHYYYGLRSACQ